MIYSNQALIFTCRSSLLYLPLPAGGSGQPESWHIIWIYWPDRRPKDLQPPLRRKVEVFREKQRAWTERTLSWKHLHQWVRVQVCRGVSSWTKNTQVCVLQNITLFGVWGEQSRSKCVLHNPPSCNLLVLGDECPESVWSQPSLKVCHSLPHQRVFLIRSRGCCCHPHQVSTPI